MGVWERTLFRSPGILHETQSSQPTATALVIYMANSSNHGGERAELHRVVEIRKDFWDFHSDLTCRSCCLERRAPGERLRRPEAGYIKVGRLFVIEICIDACQEFNV